MTAALPWRETAGRRRARRPPDTARRRREDRGVAAWDGQPCLKVRVAAPPVEGAANDALIAFLAKALDLPRSAVTLIAGDRARVKRLRLAGTGFAARLATLAGAARDAHPPVSYGLETWRAVVFRQQAENKQRTVAHCAHLWPQRRPAANGRVSLTSVDIR